MDRKNILIFIAGLFLGAAGGGYGAYTITKRYYEKENLEAANERAEYYHKKYNDIPVKEEKKDEGIVEEKSDDKVRTEEEKDIYEEVAGIYRPSEEERKVVTDYRSISNNDISVDAPISSKKKGKKKKPYIISQEIWDENKSDYNKIFATYYEADDTFVNDETDQVIDIWNDIGHNNLNDTEDLDDEAIFIANDQLCQMYMITVEHSAFSEEGL